MDKNEYRIPIVILLVLYFLYFSTTILHLKAAADILSPLLAMFCSLYIIVYALSITHRSQRRRRAIWYMLSAGFFSWGIADILWAYMDFFSDANPMESQIIINFYTITNVCLFFGLLLFCIVAFKKWNIVQLFVDATFISISVGLLLWIVFFNKSAAMFDLITKDGLSSVICISSDMVIVVGIAIWFLSLRKGSIAFSLNFIFVGYLAFIVSDIVYYYLYFNNQYIPNTLIDSCYVGGIVLITIGAIFEKHFKHADEGLFEVGTNVGFQKKIQFMLIWPLLILLYEGFVLADQLLFFSAIMLREIFSFYIQGLVYNEELLKKEIKMNAFLEESIQQRTREIEEKNNELEVKNKELDFLSNQDTVTNLYNRRYFIQALEQEIETVKGNEKIGLIFLDLDRFKTINDMYGHHIGDAVLIEISKRLNAFYVGNSILARLGGDEFVISFHGSFNYKQLEQVANKIIQSCSEPIEVDHYVFYVTASIGISIYPLDASDASTLMKNADIAMYQAKASGKGRALTFNSSLQEHTNKKHRIEMLLGKALLKNEFELYYQPQFRIPDNKLIGAEALIRWNSSILGPVSPGEFIPIAEEINMIYDIGNFVMKEAVTQVAKWNSKHKTEIKMGINVSPKQLDHKNFIHNLRTTLEENNLDAKQIDIEITETVAIEGENRIKQIDKLFEGLDVSVSIDDFGTGYSSISYLKYFPFERIKVAKELVDKIHTDNYDLQIVKSVILLAKAIGIKTIAEGVELQEQYDILKQIGCDEVQGYLLGRPVPAAQFEELFLTKK